MCRWSGIELRQQIDPAQAGIDAVRDGDIHDAVFSRERHGRLGALLGERKQSRALPPAHDHGKHIARIDGLPAGY
jgi:hypothetical protein